MLLDETLMAVNAANVYAEKFDLRLKFAPGVSEVARLNRAPWRTILRVKIENDRRAFKIRELYLLATAINATGSYRFEIRRRIADF